MKELLAKLDGQLDTAGKTEAIKALSDLRAAVKNQVPQGVKQKTPGTP